MVAMKKTCLHTAYVASSKALENVARQLDLECDVHNMFLAEYLP